MVDVSKALTSQNNVSAYAPDVRVPFVIQETFTAAQFIAAKGSAIAAADVYDLIRVPANTVILGVWAQKTAAFAGTSTDLTLDIGITGVDADIYTNDWAFDDAALNSYAPVGAGLTDYGTFSASSSVISALVATQTGTWTGGSFTLYVELLDLNASGTAGIVALGS